MTEKTIFEVRFLDSDGNVIFDLKKARRLVKKGKSIRAIGSLKETPGEVTRTSLIVRFKNRKTFETRNSLYHIGD